MLEVKECFSVARPLHSTPYLETEKTGMDFGIQDRALEALFSFSCKKAIKKFENILEWMVLESPIS